MMGVERFSSDTKTIAFLGALFVTNAQGEIDPRDFGRHVHEQAARAGLTVAGVLQQLIHEGLNSVRENGEVEVGDYTREQFQAAVADYWARRLERAELEHAIKD